MELKGTKTEKNLWEAFAGESQARNKYTYFASMAKKEGYEQLAAIFEETAGNEKEHAKIWPTPLAAASTTCPSRWCCAGLSRRPCASSSRCWRWASGTSGWGLPCPRSSRRGWCAPCRNGTASSPLPPRKPTCRPFWAGEVLFVCRAQLRGLAAFRTRSGAMCVAYLVQLSLEDFSGICIISGIGTKAFRRGILCPCGTLFSFCRG